MTAKKATTKKKKPAQVQARIIQPKTRDPLRFIQASMPTVCPNKIDGVVCGHNTRMSGGKHTDPVRREVVEYRECIKCGARCGAGRKMTKTEIEKHCTGHEEAVREYQELQKRQDA